ncbi:MAG TPA: hypothetical protein ENK75_04835 [Saprospiraceae bacterium]|nr:hypothetical protein [Saprospiraceae bacterium]
MNANVFLMLGEYVDKSASQNWRGIVYAYNQVDKSPVIYPLMAVASQQKNSQKSKRFSLGLLAIKKKRWY